jgi:hypothetical protein
MNRREGKGGKYEKEENDIRDTFVIAYLSAVWILMLLHITYLIEFF